MYRTRSLLTKATGSLSFPSSSASGSGRTVVRDPRKLKGKVVGTTTAPTTVPPNATPSSSLPSSSSQSQNLLQNQHNQQRPNLPFLPQQQQQQQESSFGSSLVSYMLAGTGVALGFTLVGAIFGL